MSWLVLNNQASTFSKITSNTWNKTKVFGFGSNFWHLITRVLLITKYWDVTCPVKDTCERDLQKRDSTKMKSLPASRTGEAQAEIEFPRLSPEEEKHKSASQKLTNQGGSFARTKGGAAHFQLLAHSEFGHWSYPTCQLTKGQRLSRCLSTVTRGGPITNWMDMNPERLYTANLLGGKNIEAS